MLRLCGCAAWFKGIEILSGDNSIKTRLLSVKRIYSKRKEFAPFWSKFFPFRVDCLIEETWCAWKQTGRHKSCLPCITKTRLYSFNPLKPHFYIVKLGFTGVYIIFLISAQNIDCGYSLERLRGSNEHAQSMFWVEIWKISEIFIWKFSLFGGKIFSIFE